MLIKRFGYYLFGLSIGIVGVYFFWQKKSASFDYGMDARTLKSIRVKTKVYSKEAKDIMLKHYIDTVKIKTILYTGDVNFSKSKPREKPCAEYFITGNKELKKISLLIKRCDSTSIIKKIFVN